MQVLVTQRGHSAAVTHVSFSPSGELVASCSRDRKVIVTNVATGQQVHCFSHDEEPKCAAFSPVPLDGNPVLMTASADGTLTLFDIGSGDVMQRCQVHTEAVHRASFSPDGSHIATASADKTARILRTQSLQCDLTISGHKGQVLSAEFSPDGRQLATASRELTARIFDIATGEQACAITQRSRVLSCRFAPSGTSLATCAMDGVRLFDACSGETILEIPSDASSVSRPVSTLAFSPQGDKLATCGDNGVCVFDFKLRRQVAHSKRHREAVSCVAFSPDGNMVATASADRTVLILSVEPDEVRAPCLQGLHCILNLPNGSSPEQPQESHWALSSTSDMYDQVRSFSHERSALGRHSCKLPFGDDEVKDVAVGPRHIAILLNDGRICRMEFGLNEGAVQDQVERAEARAMLASGRRRRLASAARSHAAHGVFARRARHVPRAERSVPQSRRPDHRSREVSTDTQRQLNADVWDQQQERDRERLGLSGRASARAAAAGSRGSVSALSGLGRAQPTFAYHPGLGLEAAAASLEMRASGLGIPRRALPASPPEAMIQVVQDMFGSVPRDVIIRDLRATGSIEATIDHLLSRNSGGSDSESNASSPVPSFDGGGSSRPSASRMSATRSAPARSSSSQTSASFTSSSAESLYASLLSAVGSGETADQEHDADCPSAFRLAEIEWWDVTERFSQMGAMLSDLVAVSNDGKLCCWPWEQSAASPSSTTRHPEAAALKLDDKSIKLLSTCDTHGVVITTCGLVASWADRCFRCSPVVSSVPGRSIASLLEQSASAMAVFEADPVTLVDTSNFLVSAVTTSGKVYWWGLKPFPQRQQVSTEQLKRPTSTQPVAVGCKVALKTAARYKTGALACSITGAPCLLELARNISTGTEASEYDFKVLPWGTQRGAENHATSRRCKLSDVIFLAGSETEELGEVLKVDGSVAAVLFPIHGDTGSAPTNMADALQKCRLVHTSELRRVDKASHGEMVGAEPFFESIPQRVQIGGVSSCVPFACSITDHKVSLLLKCVPNGKTFSYEADMANQRYSVRHMSTASETMWPSGKASVRQLVAGNTHDSMLIRDLNGAAFPSRGVPAIVAAAISQRPLPCLGGRSDLRHCNIVTMVFRHAQLFDALVASKLDEVKALVNEGGAEVALFEANQNVLHLCGTLPSSAKAAGVVDFILNCDALEAHLSRLLSAQDAHGRTPFVTSIRADNFGVAEALLAKVDLLEPSGARRWTRAGDSLHARAILAGDIAGNTSLHFLCGTGSDDGTRVHLRTMCADSDMSSKKLHLTKVLLETSDVGGAQDNSNRTALASLLVSRGSQLVDAALVLASDWEVARHTVEGCDQTSVSTAQLDEMVFRVLSAPGEDAERVTRALVDTLYTNAPSTSASASTKTSVAHKLVDSVVRVFSAVCATGKSAGSGDSASTCAQVKTSCRRVFCMMPVLAIEALSRSADAVITPVRLGMVAPIPGLEREHNRHPPRHDLPRDVFASTVSTSDGDLTGDLDQLSTEANDTHTDGEDPESADLDGDVEEMSILEFGDEEVDESARSMHEDDDEDDEDDDDDDHDEREDEDIEATESRESAAMEDDFIMDDSRHQEAVDLSADEDEVLGGIGLDTSRREREKAVALGQQTAAALYACAFGRIVKELVELHQDLLKGEGSATVDKQEISGAMKAACARLERTWEWLFIVMDCTESQLRANSAAPPQAKLSSSLGLPRNSGSFQNALLGVLRAQSGDKASTSFSSINICQYRAIAYVTDAFVYFVSHPALSVAKRPTAEPAIPEDPQLESFFVRTPSTTPHGAASPVKFGASLRRGLPLAERPHLLTPRATKRAMFGDLDAVESNCEMDGEHPPHKKQKRAPAGHVSFSAFLDASSRSSDSITDGKGTTKGNSYADAPVPEAIVDRFTPSDILGRWEVTFRRLADAFLGDVGEESHSCLSHMASFPTKQRIFRKKAAAVCSGVSNTIKIEVSRVSLLGDLFAALDREYGRRRRQPIPLACRNLQAEFKGEQGEGDGVTRGLLAAASSTLASCENIPPQSGAAGEDIPLFHSPGKEGFFAPLPSGEVSDGRICCFTNVGRIVGLSLLHNLPITLAFTRPTIKFLLGRSVSWTDLAFHSPDLYENFRKLLLAAANSAPDFAEASGGDLTFEVTETRKAGACVVAELRPGGAQEPVTATNVKSYVMLYAAHRMVESVRPALEAMRRGILQVMPETLLASLTAEDFVLLLNGCGPRVDVRWLKGITAFKDSRAEQSRLSSGQPLVLFEKLYWAAVSSMTDAERRELLYFATGSPVHPHDFSGRRLTVHVKSDTNDLPSAQVCTLEMNVPFYSDQAELKRKLLTSFKCETYDFH